MTTDRVYRPAMSQERAMAELFRCAGTQFDPILVRQFVEMLEGDRGQLRSQVATRWLLGLDPQAANAYWDFTAGPAPPSTARRPANTGSSRPSCWTTCTTPWSSSIRWAASSPGTTASERLDGHRRREHPPAAMASGNPQAGRRKGPRDRRDRVPGAGGDQLRRAVAAAAHGERAQRAHRGRRQPRDSGNRRRRQRPRARSSSCTTHPRRPRWRSAARAWRTRPPAIRLRWWPTVPSSTAYTPCSSPPTSSSRPLARC